MGIAALFRRPPKGSPAPSLDTDTTSGPKQRHLIRRLTVGGESSQTASRRRQQTTSSETAPKFHNGGLSRSNTTSSHVRHSRKKTDFSSTSDDTAVDRDECQGISDTLDSSDTDNPQSMSTAPDDDYFGLLHLTKPFLDTASSSREIDPFVDDPPPRQTTSYNDPVYISPLIFAATLYEDYDAVINNTNTQQRNGDFVAATATPGSAAVRSQALIKNSKSKPKSAATMAEAGSSGLGGTTGIGSGNLLNEFTESYNYLFGTLPSDNVTSSIVPTRNAKSLSKHLASDSLHYKHQSTSNDGDVDSQVQTSAESNSCSSPTSTGSETSGVDSDVARELQETRRKEEERKAADLRSRRRELIKQQVAFQRMKERHRKQYPAGQATVTNTATGATVATGGSHANIIRWQKESAKAVAAGAITTSNNLGPNMQHGGGPHFQLNQQQAAIYASNMSLSRANNSQGLPLIQSSISNQEHIPFAITNGGIQNHHVVHSVASVPNMTPIVADSNILASPSASVDRPELPVLTAHPVKLANRLESTIIKNPYLSDSSGGEDDDSMDSSSTVSTEEISDDEQDGQENVSPSEKPLLPAQTGNEMVSATPKKPAMSRGSALANKGKRDDSSSDSSSKSLTSSKRRVRFHETVSVVINEPHCYADDEDDNDNDNDGFESDSCNSSDASVDFQTEDSVACSPLVYSAPEVHPNKDTEAHSQDSAFDGNFSIVNPSYRSLPQNPPPIPSGNITSRGHYSPNSSSEGTISSGNNSLTGYHDNSQRKMQGQRKRQRARDRIETQPLRDREAEREQERILRGNRMGKMISSTAASTCSPSSTSNNIGGAGDAQSSAYSVAIQKQHPVDRVEEARRALLGHYHAPTNTSVLIGTSIPRSGGSTFSKTSGVKVIKPQSFARPKQPPLSTNCVSNTRMPAYRSLKNNMAKNSTLNSTTQQAESQKIKHVATKNTDKSDEFNLSNVLDNFSMSSFEVTKNKEGGMYICFTEKESQLSPNFANEASDGDDIPLSALVLSRSEPGKNNSLMMPMYRHSIDDDGSSARRSNTVETPDSTERMVRSTSMDARTTAKPIASSSSIKRKFERWGSFF